MCRFMLPSGIKRWLKLAQYRIVDLAFSQDAGLQEGYGDPTHIELIHGFLQFMQVREALPL